jgi:hypothetical protein
MQAVNDALEAQGFGPNNFSIPAFTGIETTHAALHAWDDPLFLAALQAIPEVTLDDEVTDPVSGTNQVIVDAGAQWGAQAPLLEGVTVAGTLYQDPFGTLWSCITGYNTVEYPDPYVIPALIRRARNPYNIEPWMQPIDQYDAYKLVNTFTGTGDKCRHNDADWVVTQADGSGNNVWEPGVFGWEVIP